MQGPRRYGKHHRHQEVVEVLTACFKGLLGTDRSSSYEAGALDGIEQPKYLSHFVKNLSAVEEAKFKIAKFKIAEIPLTWIIQKGNPKSHG